MTEFIGSVTGWCCFVGGCIAWYLQQQDLACTLLAASYVLGEYSSSIIIRQSTRALRTAAQVLEETRKRHESRTGR
jgi:hypothetical protein